MAEPSRTKAEIEADLDAACERLAANVASLINQVHPKAVTHRVVVDVQQGVSVRVRRLRDQLMSPDGSLNISRVALLGAAVLGAAGFFTVMRSLVRR